MKVFLPVLFLVIVLGLYSYLSYSQIQLQECIPTGLIPSSSFSTVFLPVIFLDLVLGLHSQFQFWDCIPTCPIPIYSFRTVFLPALFLVLVLGLYSYLPYSQFCFRSVFIPVLFLVLVPVRIPTCPIPISSFRTVFNPPVLFLIQVQGLIFPLILHSTLPNLEDSKPPKKSVSIYLAAFEVNLYQLSQHHVDYILFQP